MLPPFRVKNIISPDSTPQSSSSATSSSAPPAARRTSSYTDGVIRMSKEAYDDLLKRLPEAVLSYIDEEDGEVVLVGSAFELAQRLQDPLPKRSAPKDIHNLGLSNIQPPLHLFDVQRHEYVLKEWRKLEEETRVAREERIAFGETSPLSKNAPRRSGTLRVWGRSETLRGKQHEEHAKRWASYSHLRKDVSFNTPFCGQSSELEGSSNEGLSTDSKESLTTTTEENLADTSATTLSEPNAECSIDSTSNHDIPDYRTTNRGHSLQLSKLESMNLSPEELRLQDYGNTADGDQGGSCTLPAQRQRYTPLLELFQEQLSKLGTNTLEQVVDATATSRAPAPILAKANVLEPATGHEEGSQGPTTAEPTSTQKLLQEALQTPVAAVPVAPRMSIPEEGLADSLRSIMAGVGQISAALQQTRAELHATLNLARQDFPHGIQDAVKAGVAAIDALRGGPAQPTAQSASTTTADEATQAPERIENELPVQETVESWTPERIVNRRRIWYDSYPKGTQNEVNEVNEVTEIAEVSEYLVHYSGRDSSDDAWCEKEQIGVERLIFDYEHEYLNKILKMREAEERRRTLTNSAYTFFAKYGRNRLVAENPNIRSREVKRRLYMEWKDLSDVQKAPFERLALDDMERQEAEGEKKRLEAEKSAETLVTKTSTADPEIAESSDAHHHRAWPSSPSSLQLSPLEPQPYQQRTLWESAALLPTKANDAASSYMPPKQNTLWDSWMECSKFANASGVSDKGMKRASTKRLKDGSSLSTGIHTTRPWMESEDKLLIELTSDITKSQRNDPLYWATQAKKFVDRKDETLISRWNQIATRDCFKPAKYHAASADETSDLLSVMPQSSKEAVPIWAQPTKNLGKSEKLMEDEHLQHQVPGENYLYQQPQSVTFPTSVPASQGGVLADYQMQLALLEQQNKRRLLMARQEQDPCTNAYLPSVVQPIRTAPYVTGSTGPSADYQMQLMMFEHQNRRQMEMERKHKLKQRMRYMQSQAISTTSKSGNEVGKSNNQREGVQASRTTSTAWDTYGHLENRYAPSVPPATQLQPVRAITDPAGHFNSALDNDSVHAYELKGEAGKPDDMHTKRIQSVSNQITLPQYNYSNTVAGSHMPTIQPRPMPLQPTVPTDPSVQQYTPTILEPPQKRRGRGRPSKAQQEAEERGAAAEGREYGHNVSQFDLPAQSVGYMHAAPTLHYPSMLGDRWGEPMLPSQAPGVFSNYVHRSGAMHDETLVPSQSSTKKEQEVSGNGLPVATTESHPEKNLHVNSGMSEDLARRPNSGYIAEFGGRPSAPRESAYTYSQNVTDFPAYTRAMHEHNTTWSKPDTTWSKPDTTWTVVPPPKLLNLSFDRPYIPEHEAGHFRPFSTRTFPMGYYPDGENIYATQTMDTSSISPIYLRTTDAPTTNFKDFKPPTVTTGISQPAKYCYKCGIHVFDCRHTKVIALQQIKPSDVIGEAESSTAASLRPYQSGEIQDSDSASATKAPSTKAPTPPLIDTVSPTASESKKDYFVKNDSASTSAWNAGVESLEFCNCTHLGITPGHTPHRATVVCEYFPLDEGHIVLQKGEVITGIKFSFESYNQAWWHGVNKYGLGGLFPSTYVVLHPAQTGYSHGNVERCIERLTEMGFGPRERVAEIAGIANGDLQFAVELFEDVEGGQSVPTKSGDFGWYAEDGSQMGDLDRIRDTLVIKCADGVTSTIAEASARYADMEGKRT